MKKRIGILTQYYLSSNYGGLLQAYGLCSFLNDNGYDAIQISYNQYCDRNDLNYANSNKAIKIVIVFSNKFKNFCIKLRNRIHKMSGLRSRRRNICLFFRNRIPHTEFVYSESNIKECVHEFDCFIAGSDQIWNPRRFSSVYFLGFVDGMEKKKLSYAASICETIQNPYVQQTLKKYLSDYTAISVREKYDIPIVKSITEKPIEWVVDPVFLLSRETWEKECSTISRRLGKYVFGYFLGNGETERKLADMFARDNNLRLVTIPYMKMNYRRCDVKFGDTQLFDATPNDFLSLIHDAEYIFTDSFHGTAFSIIFEKKFFAFSRKDYPGMEGRISSILELMNCKFRLCNTKSRLTIDYLNKVKDMNIQTDKKFFEKMVKSSKKFLIDNLT